MLRRSLTLDGLDQARYICRLHTQWGWPAIGAVPYVDEYALSLTQKGPRMRPAAAESSAEDWSRPGDPQVDLHSAAALVPICIANGCSPL